MRRVIVLASLLLLVLIILGTAAYAGCQTCLERIVADRTTAGVTLTIVARSADDSFVFPESGSAVVMQVDGNLTKCLNVGLLRKGSEGPGVAVYSGIFNSYAAKTHSGRVDIGGQIYEFTVPLDGSAGTLAIAADQTPLAPVGSQNRPVVRVTAAPATPAPASAPASRDSALAGPIQLVRDQPAFVLGALVVTITILGAYFDRRRALARTLAGEQESPRPGRRPGGRWRRPSPRVPSASAPSSSRGRTTGRED